MDDFIKRIELVGFIGQGKRPVLPLTERVRALFSNGEQGAWYDPSDLSTMFQNSAGTTPVTAVEQPVGLILDKRLGLVPGAELVGSPLSGFSSGSWIVSGGAVTRNSSSGGQATVVVANAGNLGTKTYLVEFDVSGLSGDTFFVRVGGAGGAATRIQTNGHHVFRVGATSSTNISFNPWNGTAGEATITNITCRELPGNHASQSNAAARPVLKETGTVRRINFDGVDDKLTTTFPGLGSNATIARSVPGVGASILTGQTIGAGAWNDSTNHCGLVIVNRELTGPETASLTTYLNELAGV